MTPQGGAQGPPPGPVQCLLHPGSPFLTPVGTPDTLSESGSIKSSSRSRRAMNNSRTLPFLPPEEPAPLPSQAKSKSGSDRMKAFASFRQSSLDGLTGGMTSRAGYGGLARPRPSNSESNLRKLALEDRNRPVSALGLLQGAVAASSVVSSHGPSAAAKEHEKRILESILPPDLRHLIRGGSGASTFQSIQQIESSLRSSSKAEPSDAEIARLNAEKRLFGGQRERIVAEMQRYATMKDPRLRAEMKHKMNPVMDAQLNRNRQRQRGHRRNLSDGRISSATEHLGEDIGAYSSLPGRPYSSMSGGFTGGLDPLATDPLGLDNSQSYLGEGASMLRDSGYGGNDSDDSNRARFLASHSRLLHRRASAGGLEGHAGLSNHTSTDPYGQGLSQDPRMTQRGTNSSSNPRPHSSMSGKLGARSWHASPWQSDDETDQEHHFFKEEKKNRIKMEISRRRHQIEENARLHEELIRLAKLRENAELGTMDYNSHRLGVTGYPSPSLSPGREGQSVLRSVDEILRTEPGAPHHFGVLPNSTLHRAPGRVGAGGGREFGMGVARLGAAHHLEEHLHHEPAAVSSLNHTRAPAFNSDRYTSSVYDRVTDFSPVNSDYSNEFGHPAATQMAGIADIGSRSRKLIEDINTSSSYQPNDKYASRSNYGYR